MVLHKNELQQSAGLSGSGSGSGSDSDSDSDSDDDGGDSGDSSDVSLPSGLVPHPSAEHKGGITQGVFDVRSPAGGRRIGPRRDGGGEG